MPSLVTEFLIFAAQAALLIGFVEVSIMLTKELVAIYNERKIKMDELVRQFLTGYLYALGFGTGLVGIWVVWVTLSKGGPKADKGVEEYRRKGSLIPDEDKILG